MPDDQPQPVLPLEATDEPPPEQTSSRWSIVLVFVAVVLLLAWAGAGMLYRVRIIPPAHVTTLDEFLDEMPAPARSETRTIADKRMTILFARTDTLLSWAALPSGPAAYVFDEAGTYVDMTLDVGDDKTFRERWHIDRPSGSSTSPTTHSTDGMVEKKG